MPVPPLPPEIHSQSPTDPGFQGCEHARGRAEAEVTGPSDEVWREVCDHLLQTDPSRPACDFPDSVFEFVEGFWRNAPLAPVIRNAESEEFTFLRSRHRAFGLVDFQAELVGQEPAYR